MYTNDQTVIEVKNLTKRFGQFIAVDGISFSIKKGEIVGLLGPNGAGKTTTINMLLTLVLPTTGSVGIFGKDLYKHREEILKKTGFSASYTNLPWRLTVWENLYVSALLYSVTNPKERIEEIMDLMHLKKYQNKVVEELSSGWVTRLSLGRMLIGNPELILLDEPTANLDPEGAFEVRKMIREMRETKGITALWTAHNMAEVEEMCNRVIFLNHGRIIAEDTPEGLARTVEFCRISLMIEKGKDDLIEILNEKKWLFEQNERFINIKLNEEDIPRLLSLIAQGGIIYREISIDKPTLEDYFISIAKK